MNAATFTTPQRTGGQRSVPPEEWKAFLDAYSRAHPGWMVTLKVRTPERHAGPEVIDQPFRGATLERDPRGDVITLLFGDGSHSTHRIYAPKSLRYEQTPEGADVGIIITNHGGEVAYMTFRVATQPEQVDDITR